MKVSHDLATHNGYQKAVDFIDKYSFIIASLPYMIIKALSPEISTEKQIEAARKIIIEGKKQGVKKVKLKVSHTAGINIKSTLK